MSEEVWFLFTTALVVSMGLMFAVWVLAKRLNNAGIVDVAWALGFALVALIYLVAGVGALERKLLIATMVVIWSLRLGIYLWVRVARSHPEEDGRYAALRERFPTNTWPMFLLFFELQAVLLAVLSVPFALAASNPSAMFSPWEWAGAGLWLVAMLGEAVSDWQLHRFRSRPENKGRTCRTGLWGVSRHPNYFFEWLVWVAFFVFALGTPHGWIAIYAPVLMLYFLLRVTGVPATEAEALGSCGEEYREYQRTTSGFVPWFPRR